jgi:hypothetical protein
MAPMNAIPLPARPGSEAAGRVKPAVAWLALASIGLSCQVTAQEQTTPQEQTTAAQEQIAAVLKLRDLRFSYRSRVAQWSCGDLEARVASILSALGARNDIQVRATGCDIAITPGDDAWETGRSSDPWRTSSDDPWDMPSDRWGRSSDPWGTSSDRFRRRSAPRGQSASVRVVAMMPVAVTPEVLEEIKRDKSRRELVSRVTGNPAAALNDPIVFPAQRQLVTLSHQTIDLDPEECELLEQMSTSLFRELDIRVVRRGSSCGRTRIAPQVTVEALMPVFSNPQPVPATGTSEPDPGSPAASGSQSPAPGSQPPELGSQPPDPGSQPPEAGTRTPPE